MEGASGTGIPERVFFEHNRAFIVVLKYGPDDYRRHHLELDPDGRVRIWEEWLTKGALLFEGTFASPRSDSTRARGPR